MPQRRFELYVFDWDGTCMDTTPLIAEGIRAAARECGYPVPTFAEAEGVIGLGITECMRRVVPECPPEDYARFDQAYMKSYIAMEDRLAGLHAGLRELFQAMQDNGMWLAVATGKSRRGLARIMEKADASRFFCASRTADVTASKPAPDMLLELSDECCVPLSRMVMVGDSVYDLQMAANAGVASVGVSWGAARRETLLALNPLAVVDDTAQLAQVLGVSDLWDAAAG